MQRLFSSFADGWPGIGLLFQRLLTAGLLIRFSAVELTDTSFHPSIIPSIVAAGAGILFLLGLWTPVAGTMIAIIELWFAMIHPDQPWVPLLLGILGATVSMIGPGAWSLDARLFGRKHIET